MKRFIQRRQFIAEALGVTAVTALAGCDDRGRPDRKALMIAGGAASFASNVLATVPLLGPYSEIIRISLKVLGLTLEFSALVVSSYSEDLQEGSFTLSAADQSALDAGAALQVRNKLGENVNDRIFLRAPTRLTFQGAQPCRLHYSCPREVKRRVHALIARRIAFNLDLLGVRWSGTDQIDGTSILRYGPSSWQALDFTSPKTASVWRAEMEEARFVTNQSRT